MVFLTLLLVFGCIPRIAGSNAFDVELASAGSSFFHAVGLQLNPALEGDELRHRLYQFISCTSAVDNPVLDTQLRIEGVNSSIYELTRQMRAGKSSLCCCPESVALSRMLALSILVIDLDSQYQASPNSFLVINGHLLWRKQLFSAQFSGPDITVVKAGKNFVVVKTSQDGYESRWLFGTGAFASQLSHAISKSISGLGSQEVEYFGIEARVERGWISPAVVELTDPYLVIWSRNAASLAELEFGCLFPQLIRHYTDMKGLLLKMGSERDTEIHWQDDEQAALRQFIDSLITINQTGIASHAIAVRLQPLLHDAGMSLRCFLDALSPSSSKIWFMLDSLKKIIEQLPEGRPSRSLDSLCNDLLASSQGTCLTGITGSIAVPPAVYGEKPGNSCIKVVHDCEIIRFEQGNPHHHLLFAWSMASRTFSVVDQLLATVEAALTDPQTLSLFVRSSRACQIIRKQRAHYADIQFYLHAAIHAIGRDYFRNCWQPDFYKAVTIKDKDFVVFHSDDFAPRQGWRCDQKVPDFRSNHVTYEEWFEGVRLKPAEAK
ncbi:hypothetical protein ACWJJH_15670 [Endozoicomonadaceae bacterium StTr2]